MSTHYSHDVKLVVTLEVRITGDYGSSDKHFTATDLHTYVERLLRDKLSREPARLLSIHVEAP